jgi:hypothetical protein
MSRSTSLLSRLGIGAVVASSTALALVTSAFAGSQVPFKGSFAETFVVVQGPPVIVADASGSGHVTHLGSSSESFVGTLDFTNVDPQTGCAHDSAVGSITGARGDTVDISAAGAFCPTTGVDSGTFAITGGTGKYTGASGGGTYTSVANFATGRSSESYDGTISSPGSL